MSDSNYKLNFLNLYSFYLLKGMSLEKNETREMKSWVALS